MLSPIEAGEHWKDKAITGSLDSRLLKASEA